MFYMGYTDRTSYQASSYKHKQNYDATNSYESWIRRVTLVTVAKGARV